MDCFTALIRNVTLGDLDNYSCVAINSGGMAESRAQVALHEAAVWAELAQVSCDWLAAGHVTIVLTSDWCRSWCWGWRGWGPPWPASAASWCSGCSCRGRTPWTGAEL